MDSDLIVPLAFFGLFLWAVFGFMVWANDE